MAIKDYFLEGIQKGWNVVNATTLQQDIVIDADVIIVGTGAGGGTSAEIFAQAGLRVVMVEDGPLKTSTDFKMNEVEAYQTLYQDNGARATKDAAISILQGRAVGGTTVINWTSSFRTPTPTLEHWSQAHGITGLGEKDMAPWFELMERRLNVGKWIVPPNKNNAHLQQGCEKMGWDWKTIPRNVKGCWDLGYCGMGCPTNAKQSMLVTTIPGALKNNAQLIYRARAEKFNFTGDQVSSVTCTALADDGIQTTGKTLTLRGKYFISAAGAINGPGLLLRSKTPDPYQLIGKRTFIHPVVASFAVMPGEVAPYYGAPQSIYSDHFQWKDGSIGPMGFKLEVPPLHPALTSAWQGLHGEALLKEMQHLPNMHASLALLRDGFSEESQGGSVELRSDGSPVLDYQPNDYFWDGARRAHLAMGEAQFAVGADRVKPLHMDGKYANNFNALKTQIDSLLYKNQRVSISTAHLMGGCTMGGDEKTSVTDNTGRHHQLENLYVFDGSLFPTSIGANPQLSIYGLTAKLATDLTKKIT